MNAPLPRMSLDRARASEIVSLAQWLADDDPQWQAVARQASEPNAFAEPWFVRASAHLGAAADVRMVAVREEGQLLGVIPVIVADRYGRLPVRHVQNWQHYNSFFGAPLVRRAFEPYFWARALSLLDADADAPSFVHVIGLDPDTALARGLMGARPGAAVVHRSRRAMLRSELDSQSYYETTVRKKKRKEIARLRSRLDECGVVCFRRFDGGALDEWIDAFLALEASGWKGRRGAALANDACTTGFLRAAIHGADAADRLEFVRLDVDNRAVAMLINFLCPPGSYSFKIAFDEDFARFSPGVLLQIENLRILERPDIAWMDSCAVEGHPMIESLWGERRDIVRISVPLKGWRRRATFAACRAAEATAAMVRGWQ